MMTVDEEGTVSALRAHRNAVDPVILNHAGRIVKSTGDGVLVEFSSAVAAVSAALQVQNLMRDRNQDLPESRRMQFRVGINVGDVVIDDAGDVLGDSVNVAARIESLADPGGIAVTNAVFEAVRGKVEAEFADAGEHELKNIPTPVHIWKAKRPTDTPSSSRPAQRTLATVAVMPFDNMSGDAEQDYFADGITEDLITALSFDRSLAVVARNSTFAYRDNPADVRTVARELDATHVVEGSVRRSEDQLRITAQLIDAESGHHIWAERYDRTLADIFELQDELVEVITARLRPTIMSIEGRRRASTEAQSFDAWDLTLQGWFHANKHTTEGFRKGVDLMEQARELEPTFVPAVTGAALIWMWLALSGWRHDAVNPWERAQDASDLAYRLDPDDYDAMLARSVTKSFVGDPVEGARLARRLIDINPHAAIGHHCLGIGLYLDGKSDEAIPVQTDAWRLGRHEPWRYDTANDLAYSHYLISNYEAAVTWGEQALLLVDDWLQTRIILAAAYGQLDRSDGGRPHVEAILEHRPAFSCTKHRERLLFTRQEDREHITQGLLRAGLPE